MDIHSFYDDTFQLLTGKVNVFKKMTDAFFKIIKQREEDEMQIMERIIEKVLRSDDLEG